MWTIVIKLLNDPVYGFGCGYARPQVKTRASLVAKTRMEAAVATNLRGNGPSVNSRLILGVPFIRSQCVNLRIDLRLYPAYPTAHMSRSEKHCERKSERGDRIFKERKGTEPWICRIWAGQSPGNWINSSQPTDPHFPFQRVSLL